MDLCYHTLRVLAVLNKIVMLYNSLFLVGTKSQRACLMRALVHWATAFGLLMFAIITVLILILMSALPSWNCVGWAVLVAGRLHHPKGNPRWSTGARGGGSNPLYGVFLFGIGWAAFLDCVLDWPWVFSWMIARWACFYCWPFHIFFFTFFLVWCFCGWLPYWRIIGVGLLVDLFFLGVPYSIYSNFSVFFCYRELALI